MHTNIWEKTATEKELFLSTLISEMSKLYIEMIFVIWVHLS